MRDWSELSEAMTFELVLEGQAVASHGRFSGKSTPIRANQVKSRDRRRVSKIIVSNSLENGLRGGWKEKQRATS